MTSLPDSEKCQSQLWNQLIIVTTYLCWFACVPISLSPCIAFEKTLYSPFLHHAMFVVHCSWFRLPWCIVQLIDATIDSTSGPYCLFSCSTFGILIHRYDSVLSIGIQELCKAAFWHTKFRPFLCMALYSANNPYIHRIWIWPKWVLDSNPLHLDGD